MKKLLLVGILFLGTLTYAGCNINLLYKNVSDKNILIHKHDKNHSTAIKSKNGTWKRLANRSWIPYISNHSIHMIVRSNEKIGTTYKATFGCNAKRRYRIVYSCGNGGVFTKYYPSSSGWTKNQTVTIPVGELCKELQSNIQTFRYPTVNTRRVDWCKTWGQGCGEPAATYFCEQKGFVRANQWIEDKDIGNTLVLGDNKVCNEAGCDGFKSITCIK